jgi:hypothetical protein
MVQGFASTLGGSNRDVQVVLNLILSDELIKTAGSETRVKRYILSAGLTRYDASYLNSPPLFLWLFLTLFNNGQVWFFLKFFTGNHTQYFVLFLTSYARYFFRFFPGYQVWCFLYPFIGY